MIWLTNWILPFQENPAEEDAQIVEKILAMRTGKRKIRKPKPLVLEVSIVVSCTVFQPSKFEQYHWKANILYH